MIGSAHFRFLNLTEKYAEELEATIPIAEIETHHKTGKYVGSIELLDTSVVVAIDEFRKKKSIAIIDCDVFVSIASRKCDEFWRAPKTVNYIVNIINCPIVFSYTSCSRPK